MESQSGILYRMIHDIWSDLSVWFSYRSSTQDGTVWGLCRCERDSSVSRQGFAGYQSGWWWTLVLNRPQCHAASQSWMPHRPSCTWEDRGPSPPDPGQQKQTCQCQGQVAREDQVVRDYQEDPGRRQKQEMRPDWNRIAYRLIWL